MITLHFTNVPEAGPREFETVEGAILAGRSAGMEFKVYENNELVASWSWFSGLKRHEMDRYWQHYREKSR